jgi:peptidoglycan/xylan/chitin deacetylase (PgdA/CDA1 family)
MTPASPVRFVVTMDDPGGLIQDLALFDRARRFFDAEGVPGSFMVVPRGEGGWLLDQQPQWLAALQAAEHDGHDCQLHGLDHQNCEFGPYPAMIRVLHQSRDPEEVLRLDTEAHGHTWDKALYLDKLQTAIGIYERAFERRPLVFRTGALSQTPELYEAMAEAGMRYASNTVIDPRGWEYIVEHYDDPGDWDPDVPPAPYYLTDDIINLPMISEYAWYLTEEKIERHLALALDDLRRVQEAGGVFVLVCHVQCVGAEDGLSQQLLARLFEAAREEYGVQFQTLAQLVTDIEAGKLSVLQRL